MMQFTKNHPKTWKELQDRVAMIMCQCGYKAISPCKIETVRGIVEVDVFIESPDPLVKNIVCECKYWESRVSQEKVHAFQTVVHNSGASLGLLISKNGFQQGAIKAARLSNVKLLTWEQFITMIYEKWIMSMLKKIKRDLIPLREYTNEMHFPFEKLQNDDKKVYLHLCEKYKGLIWTCNFIAISDLMDEDFGNMHCYQVDKFDDIEAYLNFLEKEVYEATIEFEEIIKHSKIIIPLARFDKHDVFTNMF